MADIGEMLEGGGSSLVDRIKSIPPIAWVAAGGILILVFFMSKGGGGSSGVDPSGVAGGGEGEGDFSPDIEHELTSLFDLLRSDTEARAAWQKQISDYVNKVGTPNPSGSGITPSPGGIPSGGPRPQPAGRSGNNLKTPAPSPAGSGVTPLIPRAGTRGRS